MKQYTLAIEPTSFEIDVVADSEKEAKQALWAAMPDVVKNCSEFLYVIEECSAMEEQCRGVQGNPFSHLRAWPWKENMKSGFFNDYWRGDGFHVSSRRWTLAIRWRWRFAFVRPPAKPGYSRLYVGPFEIEHRKQPCQWPPKTHTQQSASKSAEPAWKKKGGHS
jgi:hypothetical protein